MHDHLTKRRRKEIISLQKKRGREKREEVLLEGVRSVESAIEAEAPLLEILTTPAMRADERVRRMLAGVEAPVYELSERAMDRMSDARTHQGVLAVARMVSVSEEALYDVSTSVVLDGVQDPGNVGTIMRTAAWFGIEALVAGPGTAGLFGPKVARAAAGSLWDVQLASVDDLPGWLARMKSRGARCYGADLGGAPVHAWQPARPSVLVLGSEAHGLSAEVQRLLDERIYIPGSPRRAGTESLNVAVASGILLHHYATAT